jgi:hypothetical protein
MKKWKHDEILEQQSDNSGSKLYAKMLERKSEYSITRRNTTVYLTNKRELSGVLT